MENEIDDIVAELEHWKDILEEDPASEAYDFATFCYVNLDVIIETLKGASDG